MPTPALRIAVFAVAALGLTWACSPEDGNLPPVGSPSSPGLLITVSPRAVAADAGVDAGGGAVVLARATGEEGAAGTGTVSLTSTAGAFLPGGGTSTSITLTDGYGRTEFACPNCPNGLVTIEGTWNSIKANTGVLVVGAGDLYERTVLPPTGTGDGGTGGSGGDGGASATPVPLATCTDLGNALIIEPDPDTESASVTRAVNLSGAGIRFDAFHPIADGRTAVEFHATLPDAGLYRVTLEAPEGTDLAIGEYEAELFNRADAGGFSFGQPGSSSTCYFVDAKFEVFDISTDGSGDVQRINATFQRRCEVNQFPQTDYGCLSFVRDAGN